MAEIYDISPEISAQTAVFPGDLPFERSVAMDFAKGDHFALSSIRTTVHIGAHVDAPIHYHPRGETMDRRSLDQYYGPCQVVTVKGAKNRRITPEDLTAVTISAPRLLFKTGTFPDPTRWNGDFASLSAELIRFLARKSVILVGIDTPSIDPAEDKLLESHQAIYEHRLANLEGIVLDHVPDGIYTLIALPLKIKDADASPVRAVLVKERQ